MIVDVGRIASSRKGSLPILTLYHYTNAAFEDEETKTKTSDTTTDPAKLSTFVTNGHPNIEATPTTDANQSARTLKSVWKNLLGISFGFFFLFLSFGALADLQSSLNPDDGMGTIALSSSFVAVILSCMFVPSYIIRKLGCKWTLVVSAFAYSTFAAANFYPTWWTLVSSSVILGVAAAPLWSAKCTYLTKMGTEYGKVSGEKTEVVVVRLFGFFFMMVHNGRIAGNLISSLTLNEESESEVTSEQLAICGAKYCNEPLPFSSCNTSLELDPLTTGRRPDKNKIYLLCAIYLACSLLAVVIIGLVVDPLIIADENGQPKKQRKNLALLVATFKQMKNPKQLLIIPLTIHGGLQQGFISADFTKAFVTCPLGIDHVGFVMVCFSFFDAAGSVLFGFIIKKVGRLPVYLATTAINVSVSAFFLVWSPDPSFVVVYFVLAALWGLTDAIWLTQNNAYYGVIFTENEEAAFSNYLLWEAMGFILSFSCSNFLCMNQKILMVLGFLILGMTGYLVIEYTLWRDKKRSRTEQK